MIVLILTLISRDSLEIKETYNFQIIVTIDDKVPNGGYKDYGSEQGYFI
jgi:hypothetical protein